MLLNFSIGAMNALRDIDYVLKHPVKNEDIRLGDARIDNKKDMVQLEKTKVLFSEDAMKKLLTLMRKTKNSKFNETGVFFYGNKSGNVIYIDHYGKDFKNSDGFYEGAAIESTPEGDKELLNNIYNKGYDVVMHYHTHPDYVKYGNRVGDVRNRSEHYSDQDLYVYAYMNKNIDTKGKDVLFLGGLGYTKGNKPGLKIVTYDDKYNFYYNLPNIYYDNGTYFLTRLEDNKLYDGKEPTIAEASAVIREVMNIKRKRLNKK